MAAAKGFRGGDRGVRGPGVRTTTAGKGAPGFRGLATKGGTTRAAGALARMAAFRRKTGKTAGTVGPGGARGGRGGGGGGGNI